MTTTVSRKTIDGVSTRILGMAQGADGASLAFIYVSSRCRTRDCDIYLDTCQIVSDPPCVLILREAYMLRVTMPRLLIVKCGAQLKEIQISLARAW